VLFAFVGAEEQGLLGSKYYARHPTFAPGRIAAVINLDGGQIAGRSRDVSFIGNSRSSIDDVARVVADFQDRVIVGDQDPSAGYYYRSDQFSLARVGVPGLFYRGGTDLLDGGIERGKALREAYIARNYHQPSDEVTADWRFDGLAEDARFGLLAGWLMADAREMQQWYAGDEFEAARMRAIAEVGGG
jgi:Zn-dependent M28 family amino/carboxypeptidase